jgi:hypothetical protein
MRASLNNDTVFLNTLRVVAIIFFVSIGVGVYHLVQLVTRCDLIVHKSIPSPDARRLAVVYEMGCGVTAGFNTKVSIAPADRPFSNDKNPPFLQLDEKHDLAIKWVSDKLIEIELPNAKTIHRNDPNARDVTVKYR